MKKLLAIVFMVLWLCPQLTYGQFFTLPIGQKSQKVKFKLINNLIIMPINVNGSDLSFILDSGVGTPILFNITDKDSVQLNNVSEITINGLGEGEPLKALRSKNNAFSIGDVKNYSQQFYVVLDKSLNFSTSLGIPVHGIIGFELFRDFVVEINYVKQILKFHDPNLFKHKVNKKNEILPIDIGRKKAYVQAVVNIEGDEGIEVKMLIDTGSSDAVWLFKDYNIDVPENNYEDYLGKGLGGDIFGKRTKVNKVTLGSFSLYDAKAAFPNMEAFNSFVNLGDRNGSIGGEILKRFNIIFDYRNSIVTLKKNSNFKKPFHYNLSGIQLQHDGVRYVSERISNARASQAMDEDKSFGNVQILLQNTTRLSLAPEIVVSGIRAGSPAESAGLKEGDVILAVNGKRIYQYKIQEILALLNAREGKKIKVLIERYNSDLLFSFVLKDLFK